MSACSIGADQSDPWWYPRLFPHLWRGTPKCKLSTISSPSTSDLIDSASIRALWPFPRHRWSHSTVDIRRSARSINVAHTLLGRKTSRPVATGFMIIVRREQRLQARKQVIIRMTLIGPLFLGPTLSHGTGVTEVAFAYLVPTCPPRDGLRLDGDCDRLFQQVRVQLHTMRHFDRPLLHHRSP